MIDKSCYASDDDPIEYTHLHPNFLTLWERRSVMLLRLTLGSLLILLSSLSLAFGSVTGNYVADNRPYEILYLTLTQPGTGLSGSLTIVTPDGKGSTKAKTQEISGIMDGTHLDLKSYALHFDGNRTGSTLLLSISTTTGDRITYHFMPTTEDVFNKMLSEWRRTLSESYAREVRENTARSLEQDNISKLSDELGSDIQNIKNTGISSDLSNMEYAIKDQKIAVEQIKGDFAALKNDAEVVPMTCQQAYQVVGHDYSQTLGHDFNSVLGNSVSVYQNAKKHLKDRLVNAPTVAGKATKEAATLQQAVHVSKYPLPERIVNPHDAMESVARYQALASDAQSRMPKLQMEVDNIVEQAKALMVDAKSIAKVAQSRVVCR